MWKFALDSTLRVSSITNFHHWTRPWIYNSRDNFLQLDMHLVATAPSLLLRIAWETQKLTSPARWRRRTVGRYGQLGSSLLLKHCYENNASECQMDIIIGFRTPRNPHLSKMSIDTVRVVRFELVLEWHWRGQRASQTCHFSIFLPGIAQQSFVFFDIYFK